MQQRAWGSHFAIGRDVVYGVRDDGKWTLALVVAHSGDYFYEYMPLDYEDGVLTLSDRDQFADYWIGPKVHRLTLRESTSLGSGVEAPNIKFELPLGKLIEMTGMAVKV